MRNRELAERMDAVVPPSGYYREWGRLAVFADDEECLLFLDAFIGASREEIDIIIAASCDGPTRSGMIFGVGGWLNEEAIKFARFVVATASTAALVKKVKQDHWDDWKYKDVLSALRHDYTVVGSENQSSNEYQRLAIATLICHAANDMWHLQDAAYIATHFEGLEPYFEFIIRSEDTTMSQLNMLLTTKPIIPLAKGML